MADVPVSVVIPAHNSAITIERAVDSVLAQTVRPLEIIVVDDGSTDGTVEALGRYGNDVTVLRQRNRGAGEARNAGVAAASGRYVGFLDADDEWLPGKLEVQFRQLRRNTNAAVLSAAAAYIDNNGRLQSVGRARFSGRVLHRLLHYNPIVTSSVILERDCLVSLGKWFRSELAPSEDWELWLRLAARHDFIISREVLVRYHLTSASASRGRSTEDLVEVHRKVYQALLEDPVLRPFVAAQWRNLMTNTHFFAAVLHYEARATGKARREALLTLRKRPLHPHLLSILRILLMPPWFRDVVMNGLARLKFRIPWAVPSHGRE
jgi:glycosyltransferase involved in cell wall biosynthesis